MTPPGERRTVDASRCAPPAGAGSPAPGPDSFPGAGAAPRPPADAPFPPGPAGATMCTSADRRRPATRRCRPRRRGVDHVRAAHPLPRLPLGGA
ncbi:hypothetical protein F1C15_11655 [Frigoribacterium sp. NBH87]|nr:hypothetical protein F1C15_11655 [Frigoribacterium sp. NBH87]